MTKTPHTGKILHLHLELRNEYRTQLHFLDVHRPNVIMFPMSVKFALSWMVLTPGTALMPSGEMAWWSFGLKDGSSGPYTQLYDAIRSDRYPQLTHWTKHAPINVPPRLPRPVRTIFAYVYVCQSLGSATTISEASDAARKADAQWELRLVPFLENVETALNEHELFGKTFVLSPAIEGRKWAIFEMPDMPYERPAPTTLPSDVLLYATPAQQKDYLLKLFPAEREILREVWASQPE